MADLLGPENLVRYEQLSTSLPTKSLSDVTARLLNAKLSAKELLDASLQALISLNIGNCSNAKPAEKEALLQALYNPLTLYANNDTATIDETTMLAAEAALAAIVSLDLETVDMSILASMLYFIDSENPSVSDHGQKHASSMLKRYTETVGQSVDYTEFILSQYFRPLFRNTTAAVTSTGRPAHSATAVPQSRSSEPEPLWKADASRVTFNILQLALHSAADDISKNWPLFVPVLVTLCEDSDITARERGLQALAAFVTKCPSKILTSTGIDAVFETTVFPTLLFLPSITPEAESLKLLRPAYEILLYLGKLDIQPDQTQKKGLLDKLFRDGILTSYAHVSEYIRIIELLLEVSNRIVLALGIPATKHLPNILRICSAVMTDSFATAHPGSILSAVKLLKTTILSCWPKLFQTESHCENVIYMLCICWVNLQDNASTISNSHPECLAAITDEILDVAYLMEQQGKPLNQSTLQNAAMIEPQITKLFERARQKHSKSK